MKSAVVFASVFLTATAAFAQAPTDAEIAHIVVTANQVDIDAGKLAQAKATNPEVKKFGQQMVTDHTGVNKSATALVTKLKVTPQDNATSKSLKEAGEKNVATLKGLQGAAFDKAYIDHEVEYHQQVLDAVDKTLIPSAQNAELKALLVKVRPAFVAHLEHARRLAAATKSSRVLIDGSRFVPATVTVRAGEPVVWVNEDPFPHTATSAAGRFDSQPIAPEQSWSYTPTVKGEFPYVCTLHQTMTGTLRVE